MTTAIHDWRTDPPRPGDHEMLGYPDHWEPTIWPATGDYNADRQRMAHALDCEYIEVRMETIWMVWAPLEAEEEWRREWCECEHPAGGDDNYCCEPISECQTTKPAESLNDFWDEDGVYCPWQRCERRTPGAVKFRKGTVRS